MNLLFIASNQLQVVGGSNIVMSPHLQKHPLRKIHHRLVHDGKNLGQAWLDFVLWEIKTDIQGQQEPHILNIILNISVSQQRKNTFSLHFYYKIHYTLISTLYKTIKFFFD